MEYNKLDQANELKAKIIKLKEHIEYLKNHIGVEIPSTDYSGVEINFRDFGSSYNRKLRTDLLPINVDTFMSLYIQNCERYLETLQKQFTDL